MTPEQARILALFRIGDKARLTVARGNKRCPSWVLAVSKRFAGRIWNLGRVSMRGFFGPDYALIAAISGSMPMMFMTRVRL